MKYNIGQSVLVNKTKEVKVIFDREVIENVEIYYTTDNKCYPLSEISENNKHKLNLTEEQISNAYKNFIVDICKNSRLG